MKSDREAEQTAAAANRSANWMLYAMVACCAAIPLALVVVAVVAGGSTFGSVSPLGWAVLVVAFVTAMLLAHRMARSPRVR